jgi:hypothetical protein
MAAFVHPQAMVARLREPVVLRRALAAGIAWGAALTIGLTALAAWQCSGVICIDEALWLAGVSSTTGVVAMAPVAAFARYDEE